MNLFQGETKYTFIEDCKNPNSVTILLKVNLYLFIKNFYINNV